MTGLAARESDGGGEPGLYFPLSTPCASGDQTIWLMRLASHVGNTSGSGLRQSIEYCGWLETNFSEPGTFNPAWICGAVHSLKPMYRTLPRRTASVIASIVSSSGV